MVSKEKLPHIWEIKSVTELKKYKENIVEILLSDGLLKQQICDNCGEKMNLRVHARSLNKHEFRCRKKDNGRWIDCSSKSVTKSSFFYKMKIDLFTACKLIILYINKLPPNAIAKEINISMKTMSDYMSFLRELCDENISPYKHEKIGDSVRYTNENEMLICEVDETVIRKNKYGKGRKKKCQ